MNLLWLSHMVPYPPKGGSLQRSFNLIRELAGRHDVHLIAFNQKAILPTEESVEESRRALGEFCRSVRIVKAPSESSTFSRNAILLGNVFRPTPYSVDLLDTSDMHVAVEELCRTTKIDLIHCDAVELAQFLPAGHSARTVLNHHNVESLLLQRRSRAMKNPVTRWYVSLQAAKLQRYESSTLHRFDLNLAVSEGDRDDLLRLSPRARVVVIPNGVDLEYFRATETPVRPGELVFMGGMTWFPNRDAVEFFIDEIWPIVKSRLPQVHLSLIGRRPEIIRAMTQDPEIAILGFVDDIRPQVANAEVVIIPIRVGGGTRLKILDAFACAKAVVSTRVGCEGIDVEHNKNILIGDSPEEFAREVIRVCTDSALREALGRGARLLVEEKYSWTTIGGELARQYESLASGARG
jgi:glycosyltransferase involved in cell wall biosynthesis